MRQAPHTAIIGCADSRAPLESLGEARLSCCLSWDKKEEQGKDIGTAKGTLRIIYSDFFLTKVRNQGAGSLKYLLRHAQFLGC